jgi:uncharacterized protein YaiE (UPF0345 family)
MAATSHNIYFDGGVQSLGFEPEGPRASVGVIQPGTYEFGTAAPERMTVVAGSLDVRLSAAGNWSTHPKGTVFEVPGDSSFEVRADAPSAYLCEYL